LPIQLSEQEINVNSLRKFQTFGNDDPNAKGERNYHLSFRYSDPTGKPIKWDPENEKMIDATPKQMGYLDRKIRKPYTF
jgi:hypothetical protein